MKRMVLFVLLIAIFYSRIADAEKIAVEILADKNFRPYTYVEKGEIKGIYTEIVKIIFDRIDGYKVTLRPVSWKYGLHLLKIGKGFALYPPYLHLQKRPYIRPYSLPIIQEQVVVFCNAKTMETPRDRWPEDFFNLTISNMSGFTVGGKKFFTAVRAGKIKIVEGNSHEAILISLGKGDTNCYINDRLSILYTLERMKKDGRYLKHYLKLIEAVKVSVENGYLGFTKNDKGQFPFKIDFVTKFNKELVKMIKSGERDKIIKEFLER